MWTCKKCGVEVTYVTGAGCTIEYSLNKDGDNDEIIDTHIDDIYDGSCSCSCGERHYSDVLEETAIWND